MRITIEVDEKSGPTSGEATSPGSSSSIHLSTAATPSVTVSSPPADVMEQAAASGAINAGPAPAQAGATSVAPHPFHSQVGAMSEAAKAAAESGGPAPNV